MIGILVAFLFLFGVFFLGIRAAREMTSAQALSLIKTIALSLACSLLTLFSLILIVVLF